MGPVVVDDGLSDCLWMQLSQPNTLYVYILPEICWKEIAEEILFVFCFDVWPGAGAIIIMSTQ